MAEEKRIDLQSILNRDPVAEAESFLGKLDPHAEPFDKDKAFAFLGHAMSVNRQKAAALKLMDDTCFSNTVADYLRIIGSMGFYQVLALPFKGEYEGHENETFFIYFRDDGLLLSFETYGDHINGGKVCYNWRPTGGTAFDARPCLSSGGWRYESEEAEREIAPLRPHWEVYDAARNGDADAKAAVERYETLFSRHSIWSGDHDCREALRHNIGALETFGRFVTPWVEQPFLWLLHYMDTKTDEYDHKKITTERIAMLPANVRAAIGPYVR